MANRNYGSWRGSPDRDYERDRSQGSYGSNRGYDAGYAGRMDREIDRGYAEGGDYYGREPGYRGRGFDEYRGREVGGSRGATDWGGYGARDYRRDFNRDFDRDFDRARGGYGGYQGGGYQGGGYGYIGRTGAGTFGGTYDETAGGPYDEWSDLGDRNPGQGFRGGWGGAGGGYGSRDYGTTARQSFAGRGPRGYRRSDERIRDDVNEALMRHHDIDASDIEVRVKDGEVTLTGEAEDRRAKRLAEDVAEQVSGVNEVHNQIKARRGLLAGMSSMLSRDESDRERSDRDRERTRERNRGDREVRRTTARENVGAAAGTTGGRARTATSSTTAARSARR